MADYLSSVLNEYGLGDKKDKEPSYLDSVLGEYGLGEQKAPASRNPFAVANDLVITGANAALGGAQAVSDFISPNNKFSQGVEELIKEGESKQSDVVKEGRRKLGQALDTEDVGTQLRGVKDFVLQNPGQAAAMAAGSFAIPFGAIKGAKGVSQLFGLGEKAAGRVALGTGMTTSGVLAGGDAAGDAYQAVMNSPALADKTIEERERLATDAARKASAVPFVLGAASGLVGADRALATGTRSLLKTGAAEFASEAVEEGATKLSANIAADLAGAEVGTFRGVAGAAALGGVLGGGTGLAVGALTKQPDSLLPGSTNISSGQISPDENAINKAIDANSSEITASPRPTPTSLSGWPDQLLNSTLQFQMAKGREANVELIQQIDAEIARRGGTEAVDSQAQARNAQLQQQQQAAQAQQQAAQAQAAQVDALRTDVFNKYGGQITNLPGGTKPFFNFLGKQYFTLNDMNKAVDAVLAKEQTKPPMVREVEGALASVIPVVGAKPYTPAKMASFLNPYLNEAESIAEVADRIDARLANIKPNSPESDTLTALRNVLRGEPAEGNITQLNQGVNDGQLQLQNNAGLRAVSEQGGATQTGGTGSVRPTNLQSVQSGSLNEGSLGLQTGALPSGGISTGADVGRSGINIPNAGSGQAQDQGQVNASQPQVTIKKRRSVVPDQTAQRARSPEQQSEETATNLVETVVRNVIDAVVKRRGRMSNVNLEKLKDFIYYDFSQIENRKENVAGLTKKELAEMFNVSTDTIDGWQDIANNFFENNRGVIQAQLYQALDDSGMSLLELKEQIQATREDVLNDAITLEEGQRAEPSTKDDEQAAKTKVGKTAAAADQELTEVDESQLDQRELGAEDSGMSVMTGRKGASVQEQNKPEETVNARYIRKTKELEAAENSGDEALVAKLSKELDDLVNEASGIAKKQVAKSEAIAEEKKKEPKNAVQKRSTKGVSVRKQAEVSEGVPSEDTEGGKAAAEVNADEKVSSLTVEEQAAKAWDAAAKNFPDAPKFAELTEDQQADFVSFGPENWTADDVQTELIKLAKESITDKAQFSRNEGAGKDETWDQDGLTSLLKQMFVANKNFDNLVTIVSNYDELPTYVKNAVKKSSAIQAFVYGKRVYMLADQIQIGQELPVFLHEVGVHVGMENLLGTANYRKLVGQVMTWSEAKNDSLETIIARKAKERVDAASADAIANGDPLTADDKLDEMLAYFVEEAVALGVNPSALGTNTSQVAQWFRSLVAALKVALRKVGFDKFDKLSAGNIVDLAFGAAKLEISGAYHGTAAEFRDFRTAHIGTGEGAVAFGWGLYMAERFGIALDYMRSDVKRKQIRKTGEPDITYKGIGYKELSGMNHELFKEDRLEYDRRNIAATMVRDLHYDYNNTLTVQSLINKKIDYYERELKATNDLLKNKSSFLGTIFAANEKKIKEAENNKDYYERSLAAIKTIDPNDFDFPSKAGFTYKGRTKKELRRSEMQNLGANIENKVALDVVRQYEQLKEDFGVPAPVEEIIQLQIQELEKSIANNEIGALSGTTQKTIDALKALNPKDFKDSTKKPGNLMRVLPMAEESALMDLDTELRKQPEILKKIIDGFPQEVLTEIDEKSNLELEDMTGRDLQRVLVDLENQGLTDLFFQMPDSITDTIKQGNFMSEEIVSKYLEYKLGIEGVKYFDASSRSVGGQVSVAKLPELEKIKFEVNGKKFYPKYASIRSSDVIIKGRLAGQTSDIQIRLRDFVSETDIAAVIDHIKEEQARQTKNVVMFKDKGISRVATFPGARLDSKVKFSLAKAREQSQKQMARLPKSVGGPLQALMDNIYGFAKKGLPTFAFTEDLADIASKLLPSARKYVTLSKERDAIKTKFERQVDKVLQMYDKLPESVKGIGENSVNRLIKDFTMSGKWGYNPGWIKGGVTLDPELKTRFEAMPIEAQNMIKAVFTHGQNTLLTMQKSVTENINSEYDALIADAKKTNNKKEEAELTKKKAAALTDYSTLMRTNSKSPYAPLKRFGNYVVVGYSQQYLENEVLANSKTATPDVVAEAKKKIRELEKNEDHYFVQFAETRGEARAIARDEQKNYALVDSFEKDQSNSYGGRDVQNMFYRLRNMVEESKDSNLIDASEKAMNRLLADLHLTLLSEQSARQSERRRRKIAGAEDDMMRSFATQGRATANFIASLANTGSIYDVLREMKQEADARGGTSTREERRRYYNEFMKRQFMGMEYNPSPYVDKALSVTSMWMLLTNPAYYLQNMTQPFMMSLPSIGAKHGYTKSWKEFTKAYKEIFTVIKDGGLDESTYGKLPADVRSVVEELVNRGRIDISLEQDLGRWRSTEDAKLAKFGRASELLRTLAQNIETVNRVATAVAAYRLESKVSNPTRALNYADKVIYTTHGDYSTGNAPRFTREGIGRLATQFRKFQLIQISLMARLYNDAFRSEDPQTRMIGKRALAYTIGHTAVVGGAMGLPGFYAIAAIYGLLFGDDDEPFNAELELRRAIGNDTIADLLLKGVPAAIGVDLSGKLGMGQMLSLFPYSNVDISRKGVYELVGTAVTGPFGALLGKTAEGISYMGQGEYYKGVEQMLPSGLSNVAKAYRFATEGVTNRAGDVLLGPDELDLLETMMTAIGLPPKQITDRQFLQATKFEFDEFYNDKASEIKRAYTRASKENDTAAQAKAREDWKKLQESRAKNGYVKQPLSSLLKAPQEQKKRERNVAGGVQFNRANKGFVRQTSEL
jgi:hypothetical protein